MAERLREARVKTWATVRVYAVNEVNIGDFWIDWVRGCNSCIQQGQGQRLYSAHLTPVDTTEAKNLSDEK